MTADWLIAGEGLIWLVAVGIIALAQERSRLQGVGLVLAYALNLWLIHWPGAVLYVFPWYWNWDPEIVESGFRQSTFALVAFTIGSIVLAPMITRRPRSGTNRETVQPVPVGRLELIYLAWGLVCFTILVPFVGQTPTARAIVSAGSSMLTVGLGLNCRRAWGRGRPLPLLGSVLLAGCLPLLTIVRQGYLGPGIWAFLAVVTFVSTFRSWPLRKVLAVGVLLAYVGLSFYVTYMRDRSDIREMVWTGASFAESAERVYLTVRNLEWFDPFDDSHLSRIDDRLNQNELVGLAIAHMASGGADFASGETLWQAVIALVPRVFWPDKPIESGSMDLVSRYTGLEFSEDTSVGVGQVLEFYINFGTIGVILGSLGLGTVISFVDSAAQRRLAVGDLPGFALWYMPGLCLLLVGGSLVDVTTSAAAAVVNVLLVNFVLLRFLGAKKPVHV